MSEPRGRSRAENGPAAPAGQAASADKPAATDSASKPAATDSASKPAATDSASKPAATDSNGSPRPSALGDRPRSELSAGAARRAIMIGTLVVLGIAGVAGGTTLLARNLTHAASTGVGDAQTVATRWQRLPAGQIFPAAIQYVNAQNVSQSAHRVGIAPAASCLAGLDPAASATMTDLGCTMVLRATYADQSGALLATVGVAVVASPRAAVTAAGRMAALRPPAGVRPVPFSGTIADLFQDAQRAAFGTPIAAGRYVFFYAAGYSDGRLGQSAGSNPDLDSLGRGLVTKVEHILSQGTA